MEEIEKCQELQEGLSVCPICLYLSLYLPDPILFCYLSILSPTLLAHARRRYHLIYFKHF